MIIGLPKEIKKNEYRVAATPSAVAAFVRHGHTVLFEPSCGVGSGFSDEEYLAAGGTACPHEELYRRCDMLYKVKEIEPSEYDLLHEGQIVFTYLHSNAHPEMTKELLARGVTGVAYEDIDDERGMFPALAPMSVLAGKGGFIAALYFSQSVHGGKGLPIRWACPSLSPPPLSPHSVSIPSGSWNTKSAIAVWSTCRISSSVALGLASWRL